LGARYFLIGAVVLIAVAGVIGWHFFDWRGEVLKPNGGLVVTVMDFGQSFPLAGNDTVGRWLDERIELARVYAEIWKDAAPTHLIDVAVFCDSDDTHTASISYFAYVRLERR
jgi:hypothetical protein